MTDVVDWTAWARRWDEQQAHGIILREERFRVMLELVAEIVGPEPTTILDLACGTGSISARAVERFPSARLVALDVNPLLLAIGQGARREHAARIDWVRADLSGTDWPLAVERYAPFDAVLSSTALHWLPATGLVAVYQALAGLIRSGGVFLNAEHLLVSAPTSRLATAAENVRKRLNDERRREGESYAEWWDAVRLEPALAELVAEHDRIFPSNRSGRGEQLTAAFHVETLRQAGFDEAAVLWRYLDNTIVGGIR